MKGRDAVVLLLVIVAGATIANLIALKIAADQVKQQVGSATAGNPAVGILGALLGRSNNTP